MTRGLRSALALCLLLAAFPGSALAAEPRASFPDVEEEVMCDTCNVALYVAESPRADQLRREVRTLIAQLSDRYGPATTVTLRIRAQDVQHSWWIPALGGKFDAVPGYTNFTWFKAKRLGTYTGQCAELCGRNHANMTARVTVVSPAAYQAWFARQKRMSRPGWV